MFSGFRIVQSVGERVPPAELGCVVVGIGHLDHISERADAVRCAAVNVPCVVDVRLVRVSVDAAAPMLKVSLRRIHRRSESMDQLELPD